MATANYLINRKKYLIIEGDDFKDYKNKEFSEFYYYIKQKENIVFSCHDQKEANAAKEIDANAKIFYSN